MHVATLILKGNPYNYDSKLNSTMSCFSFSSQGYPHYIQGLPTQSIPSFCNPAPPWSSLCEVHDNREEVTFSAFNPVLTKKHSLLEEDSVEPS